VNALDSPILTPSEVLEKRGIRRKALDADMAIICFRGQKASKELINSFSGIPFEERILRHPYLYHSQDQGLNLLIVPEMIWGGPATAMVIEELFVLGVQILIGFGAGGSINPEVQPGEIFIARRAICVDGTSKEYSDSDEVICSPDPELLNYCKDRSGELDVLLLNGLTTDSLYRETPRKVENWRRLGADFINMEVSPFYSVCKALGIRAIYIGLITDFLGERWESKYWNTENEVDKKIIESIKDLCAGIQRC